MRNSRESHESCQNEYGSVFDLVNPWRFLPSESLRRFGALKQHLCCELHIQKMLSEYSREVTNYCKNDEVGILGLVGLAWSGYGFVPGERVQA